MDQFGCQRPAKTRGVRESSRVKADIEPMQGLWEIFLSRCAVWGGCCCGASEMGPLGKPLQARWTLLRVPVARWRDTRAASAVEPNTAASGCRGSRCTLAVWRRCPSSALQSLEDLAAPDGESVCLLVVGPMLQWMSFATLDAAVACGSTMVFVHRHLLRRTTKIAVRVTVEQCAVDRRHSSCAKSQLGEKLACC